MDVRPSESQDARRVEHSAGGHQHKLEAMSASGRFFYTALSYRSLERMTNITEDGKYFEAGTITPGS